MLGCKWLLIVRKGRVDLENKWSWRRWNAVSRNLGNSCWVRTEPLELVLVQEGGYLFPRGLESM